MPDLESEFSACLDPLGEVWFERFRQLGIPDNVTFGPRSLVGVGQIVPHNASGLFEFAVDGEEALVIAEGEPDLPGWHYLSDLIAFKPADPARWWLRRGEVDLLGAYNLRPWKLSATTIHANPLSWLRAGASGICIVDWRHLDLDWLSVGGHLVAESEALRDRLRAKITEGALAAFDIEVAREVRNAA